MNMLLLEPTDFTAADRARIAGRQLAHLLATLKPAVGDILKVGLIGGQLGTGQVLSLSATGAELAVTLQRAPPPPLPVTLVLALPRPKMLRRILQTTAAMGVKQLFLINSFRVEKSYWQSPWLRPQALREQLLLGLEQGVDTRVPEVWLRPRFKPFVEDELPALTAKASGLVGHPPAAQPVPVHWNRATTLVIGPEGGFIPYEIEHLLAAGCAPVSLGPRILRVETAIPMLLGRLFTS